MYDNLSVCIYVNIERVLFKQILSLYFALTNEDLVRILQNKNIITFNYKISHHKLKS